jgi:hypothetical protein
MNWKNRVVLQLFLSKRDKLKIHKEFSFLATLPYQRFYSATMSHTSLSPEVRNEITTACHLKVLNKHSRSVLTESHT